MNDADKKQFKALMDDTSEYYDKSLSQAKLRMYFEGLRHLSIDQVRFALSAHIQKPEKGTFMPKVADILEQVQDTNGYLADDEAWSLAAKMMDEESTCVAYDEIMQAWDVAREIMPDRTGARMAFKTTYNRLVEGSKRAGKKPNWFASLGHDVQAREAEIDKAVKMGRLPASQKQVLLPPKQEPQTLMIEGTKNSQVDVKNLLLDLKKQIESKNG